MTDADGDNVDFTPIPSGSYEYKFSKYNWNIQKFYSR